MIEPVGADVAQIILGSEYNASYNYTLETDGDGMRLIGHNPQTNHLTTKRLSDTPKQPPSEEPSVEASEPISRRHKQNVLSRLLQVFGGEVER